MGHQEQYPTSAKLDELVLRMHGNGIAYAEAIREFQKQFILTVLRDFNWNASKAAPVLRMHRNTLCRILRDLNLDIHALRKSERRPAHRVHAHSPKRLVS